MIIKKQSQSGFGHVELLAVVVFVALVGLISFRVVQTNRENARLAEASQQQDEFNKQSSDLDALETTDPKDTEEEKKDEPVEEEPKPAPAPEPEKKTEPETEDKPKPTYIKFKTSSHNQTETELQVSATMESSHTGTCNFKFLKDSQDKIYQTNTINSSATCAKNFALSTFPVTGEWEMHIWFVSDDKKTEAYFSKTITVNP